jgi:DNA-directed RNA polymerase specialized sigma24 family protein
MERGGNKYEYHDGTVSGEDIALNALLAIRELPPMEQAAVALRDIWGHPYDAVASRLQVPEDEARNHVVSGRRNLKGRLFDL